MTTNVETTVIRIKTATVETIQKILSKNPIFKTHAAVIEEAVDLLNEKGFAR